MFTWINGPLVVAWILLTALAVWLPGYINLRIRIRARHRIMAQRGFLADKDRFTISDARIAYKQHTDGDPR